MNRTLTLQNVRIKCIYIFSQQICVDNVHVPGSVLGSGDTAVSKTAKVPDLMELTF